MRMEIANDTMQMIKSVRSLMKALVVNRPGHLIYFRPGEVQHFIFNHKTAGQNIFTRPGRIQKHPGKPWQNKNRPDFHRQTLFFLHYIEYRLSLSTIKQIQFQRSTTTIKQQITFSAVLTYQPNRRAGRIRGHATKSARLTCGQHFHNYHVFQRIRQW